MKPDIPEYSLQSSNPSAAYSGVREAYWPEKEAYIETSTYVFEQLNPGNELEGPAIIEGELTTVVLPPGQKFHIDKHGLGIMESIEVVK